VNIPELPLRNWLRVLPFIAVIITAVIFTLSFIYQTQQYNNNEHKQIEALILAQSKTLVKDRVLSLIQMIQDIQNKNRDKSLEEQKERIRQFVQGFEYKDDNSVYVFDLEGNIITHTSAPLAMTRLWNEKRSNTIQKYLREMTKDSGSFTIHEPTLDSSMNTSASQNVKMLTFIKKIPSLDWVIASNVSLLNLNLVFQKNKILWEENINDFIINNIFIAIVMTFICVLFIYLPSNNISLTIQRYKKLLLHKNQLLEEKIKTRSQDRDTLLSLFDHTDAVLFKWKYSSSELTYISKSIAKLTGYSEEDFIDNKITYKECIHKDDFVKYITEYTQAIQNDKLYYESTPYRIITKDNQIKWIHDYKLFVKDDKGNISNFVGYITDITLLKEYDLSVANQSKMLSLAEMMENISHQWRQPLSAISTAASGMRVQKECGVLDDEILFHSIDGIMRNSQYLSETINYFTNYIQNNQKPEAFEINDVIHNNLHLIEPNVKMHQINVMNDLEYKMHTHGNLHELLQVTMNIINNAIDILKDKEHKRLIFIETNCIDNFIQIMIRDNAGGIPKEILNKVFEPYFTTKHKSLGTGLGLYMAHTIVDNMKGRLLVKNVEYIHEQTKYKGAEFTINLPLAS